MDDFGCIVSIIRIISVYSAFLTRYKKDSNDYEIMLSDGTHTSNYKTVIGDMIRRLVKEIDALSDETNMIISSYVINRHIIHKCLMMMLETHLSDIRDDVEGDIRMAEYIETMNKKMPPTFKNRFNTIL
jgi:uncharacterized protein (UPF0248 family)